MLRSVLAIGAAVLLAACAAGPSGDGTAGPSGDSTSGRKHLTDAAKTAAVQQSITEACAEGSFSFCDELTQASNGGPNVAVHESVLTAGIHASAEADADEICHSLAAFRLDGDAQDLGYTKVIVFSGGSEVAICEFPS